MKRNDLLTILSLAVVVASCLSRVRAEEKPAGVPDEYKLLYAQDFSQPSALDEFTFTDASAWQLAKADSQARSALELIKQSKYKPPHRSPVNIALLQNLAFGDFIMDVDCLQTGKEYGHRDMIFVFGFQSPAKFYYTHIATKGDDHANQIFIVNDAARTKISKQSNAGNNWGLEEWHHVRIERTLADGMIKVYFDDLTKPIMIAEDKTFGSGWIGLGSFDDTGKIANLKIWGKSAERKTAPAFADLPSR